MKVKDVIEDLQKFDPEMEIIRGNYEPRPAQIKKMTLCVFATGVIREEEPEWVEWFDGMENVYEKISEEKEVLVI